MGPKRILIIEDEKPLAHALELKLTHEGYETKAAYDGEEGLALLEKEHFDLIICDLMMPKVDGFGVLEEAQARALGVPVIVLTNLAQDEDKKKVLDMGAKSFFVKSNTPLSDIVAHVKATLQ